MGCGSAGALAANLELVPNGAPFVFVVVPVPAPGMIIAARVEQGFDQLGGFIVSTVSVPPGASANLHIQQSMDGVTWDYDQIFSVVDGGCPCSFDVPCLARYIRLGLETLAGATMTVRLSGMLRTT